MASTSDLRNGFCMNFNSDIWTVVEFLHVKPGKGAAFVRSKLKNLRTGAVQEKTFRAGEKVGKAHIANRKMQFLYESAGAYVFMDTENYEQIELNAGQIEYELDYLKENMEVNILMYESETIGVDLPNTAILRVEELQAVQNRLKWRLD